MTTNIITQCIELFDLLPTTPLYKWAIAADWIQEEQDIEITANAIREDVFVLEDIENENINVSGYDNVDGFGNGNGGGYSSGGGRGDGNGCGYGYANAHGNGRGWGNSGIVGEGDGEY